MDDDKEREAAEGTRLMLSGAGLGLVGAASAAVLGASCPLCVVGAPALVAWGAYKRWTATRDSGAGAEPDGSTESPPT